MPGFEEHCAESQAFFGKDFAEVHLWLDEFAGTVEYDFRHRRKRHQEAGKPMKAQTTIPKPA